VSVGEKTLAAIAVIFGAATLLCIVAGLLAARRDRSVGAGEAVQDAPPRFVGRAVVAGDDLVFQASLNRMQQELDALLAYGEDR
jgi:hypothetical protein